jgi:hypothetical protein
MYREDIESKESHSCEMKTKDSRLLPIPSQSRVPIKRTEIFIFHQMVLDVFGSVKGVFACDPHTRTGRDQVRSGLEPIYELFLMAHCPQK